MPANVEIKAKVKDVEQLLSRATEISRSSGETLVQTDTFFNVPKGRLKLRELGEGPGQLIYYEREDTTGPKHSNYSITEIPSPEDLKVTLGLALGVKGQVKKHRTLFMVGQTRVHVDKVDGLGNFMELEVMLLSGQTIDDGQHIAQDLMQRLGINSADLMAGAYMDLIMQKPET